MDEYVCHYLTDAVHSARAVYDADELPTAMAMHNAALPAYRDKVLKWIGPTGIAFLMHDSRLTLEAYDPTPYTEAFADHTGDMPEYCTTIRGHKIAVDKDGGGTLGRAYTGTWTVSVMNGDVYELDGETLRTGTLKTHKEVAQLAVELAWAQMDEEN